jgi:hypothetical protein
MTAGATVFGTILLIVMVMVYITLMAVGWKAPPNCWVLYTMLSSLVALVSLGALSRPKPPPRHGDDDGGDTV